jgi:ATP-dependent Clp protease ATP-binding subunit ClpA
VGKTWLAKSLAAQYYGSEKDMIRIDMSESTLHRDSRGRHLDMSDTKKADN